MNDHESHRERPSPRFCNHCGAPTHRLDDWVKGVPDAWDYDAVLADNDVRVVFQSGEGWTLVWPQGVMHIGLYHVDSGLARAAAALFVELWLRGVSASFADKLMDAYIIREKL